jgi:hypothetical protein
VNPKAPTPSQNPQQHNNGNRDVNDAAPNMPLKTGPNTTPAFKAPGPPQPAPKSGGYSPKQTRGGK